MIAQEEIGGVILAGGKAARMGFQDKPLLELQGKALIEHVIARAAPQVATLILSVNHNLPRYHYLNLPLVPDLGKPYAGPLHGIYSAMRWFEEHSRTGPGPRLRYLACFAADVPVFPVDVVAQLGAALHQTGALLAVCKTGAQLQPLFSLWSFAACDLLTDAISARLVGPMQVLPRITHVEVPMALPDHYHFFNINTPTDLQQMEN